MPLVVRAQDTGYPQRNSNRRVWRGGPPGPEVVIRQHGGQASLAPLPLILMGHLRFRSLPAITYDVRRDRQRFLEIYRATRCTQCRGKARIDVVLTMAR